MSEMISVHAARTALNRDDDLRDWAEQWLKASERAAQPQMSDEEFARHWRYTLPEIMHEGAVAAVSAYRQRTEEH